MTPYLTDVEIAEICAPLVMPAAQVRYLAKLGLLVQRKPNGRPLVARGEFDRVMIGRQAEVTQTSASSQPNRAALVQLLQKRGRSGSQAQGR
jgi:hypothetical protein